MVGRQVMLKYHWNNAHGDCPKRISQSSRMSGVVVECGQYTSIRPCKKSMCN